MPIRVFNALRFHLRVAYFLFSSNPKTLNLIKIRKTHTSYTQPIVHSSFVIIFNNEFLKIIIKIVKEIIL
jgi:hypothetical protein